MTHPSVTRAALDLASGRLTLDEVIALLPEPDAEVDLSVAEAAEFVGLSPHALRYYEREALVEVPRDAQGHRRYDAATLRRLVFLVRMRVAGMGMGDLRRYVELINGGAATVPERLDMMLEQRDVIRRRIAELQLSLAATEYKIATYGGQLGDEFGHGASHATGSEHEDHPAGPAPDHRTEA